MTFSLGLILHCFDGDFDKILFGFIVQAMASLLRNTTGVAEAPHFTHDRHLSSSPELSNS
jgi:hypothetical protein